MYTRGITLPISRTDSRWLLLDVIDFVATGCLDPLAIPTTVVPWDEAPKAMAGTLSFAKTTSASAWRTDRPQEVEDS
jgi:hypothetical protein